MSTTLTSSRLRPRDIPIVVLGFSGETSPFDPHWPATHRALLPICGKSVLVHLMESLATTGYRHVRVAGAIQQLPARRRLGMGDEWGLRIRYTDIHANDLVHECLAANGRCLLLNGDELHAYPLDLTDAQWHHSDLPQVESGAVPARLWQVSATGEVGYRADAPVADDGWVQIDSVRAYHEANQKLVAGSLDLTLPGVPLHDFGAYVDWRSEIAPDAYVGRHVFIGKHVFIDRQARLEERCVLSNGVIVGPGCRLANVTVLPNCQIREGVTLRDAVITAEGIYDLTEGCKFNEASDMVTRSRGNQETITGLPDPLCR